MSPTAVPRLAALALLAALAAGCAAPAVFTQKRLAPGEPIVIQRIERLAWNAPPEPNLFRVEFGERASREIRRRAEVSAAETGVPATHHEFTLMETESEGEFQSRGLCPEGGRVVNLLADGEKLTAHFRCRPKPLF